MGTVATGLERFTKDFGDIMFNKELRLNRVAQQF